MGKILNYGLRAFQLFCSVIVLGTSVSLIKGQIYGSSPAILYTGAAVGVVGIISAIYGIVAPHVSSLNPKITLILDSLVAFLFLALGVAFAVKLGIHSCSNANYTGPNSIINGGSDDWVWDKDDESYIMKLGTAADADKNGKFTKSPRAYYNRCHRARADAAFFFIGFIGYAVTIAWGLLHGRKSGDKYVV